MGPIVSLLSRQAVPLHGLLVILRHTLALEVYAPEGVLGKDVALLSRQAVPLHGLLVILGDAKAVGVPDPEVELGPIVSLLSRQTQLFNLCGLRGLGGDEYQHQDYSV